MKFYHIIILNFFLCCCLLSTTDRPKIRDNWQSIANEQISLKKYFRAEKEPLPVVLVLFRAEDCLTCISNMAANVKEDKCHLVGIVSYLKTQQLSFLKHSPPAIEILLDPRYQLIRRLRILHTPALFRLDKNLILTPLSEADLKKYY